MEAFRIYLLLYSTVFIWTVIGAIEPVTNDENRSCLKFPPRDDFPKVFNGSWVEQARNYNDFEKNTCQGIYFSTIADNFMMQFKVDPDTKMFGTIKNSTAVIQRTDNDNPHTISVVATDIENYAVLYACEPKNVSEFVWVLVRSEEMKVDLESVLVEQPKLLSLFSKNACKSTSEEETPSTDLPPLIPAFNYNDRRVFFISQLLIKLSE